MSGIFCASSTTTILFVPITAFNLVDEISVKRLRTSYSSPLSHKTSSLSLNIVSSRVDLPTCLAPRMITAFPWFKAFRIGSSSNRLII